MAEYFSHDYNSRNDPKMLKLLQKMGYAGHGIFWALIEILYEQGGYLMLSECDCIAFDMRIKKEELIDVIENYNLFKNDGKKFWSESAIRRIEKQIEKSKKAKKSADYRWEKYKRNANAEQSQCKGNAIKYNIIKESIVKENKERTYKNSYWFYLKLVIIAYRNLINDETEIKKQEEFFPNVDIQKSLERSVRQYWGTKAGWKNKKSKRTKDINMKLTLLNNIDKSKVWKEKNNNQSKNDYEPDFPQYKILR